MRRAQNAGTHALKQPRLSQNISPAFSSFVLVIASDMHLESESEKRAKNVDLYAAKRSRYNKHFFAIFRLILETHLRPIYCSLTCVSDNTAARVSARNLRSKLSARQCAYSHCRRPKTKQTKNCGCVALTRVGTVSVHSMLVSAFIGRTTPRRIERQCWHFKKTISGTGFQLMSSVTEGLKYGRLDPGLSLLMVKISDHYLLGYCHLVELWAKGNTGESFIWDLTTPQSKGSEMGESWLLLIKRIEKNWWKGEQLRLILWDT